MHKKFLISALEQAQLGRGYCAPNPSVGAVAVRDGNIIAQAWHRGAGTAHAEQLLLAQLPKDCSEISLYVTLEPCNHWGRTPPCSDAIIERCVQRVVYAYADPNPLVARRDTTALLKAHQIDVVHYPLPEIDQFYASYRRWVDSTQPTVTAKIAQTLDGKIAACGGQQVMISNQYCHDFTHKMRCQSDVILTTAATVNQDNPLLNVRLGNEPIAKPVAIIDRRGLLREDVNIFTTAKHCHIFYDERYPPNKIPANTTYYPVFVENGIMDLKSVISQLGQIGFHDVWVEAGAQLFSALHQQQLVHKTYVYLAPKLLGERALSGYISPDIFDKPHQLAWYPMGDNMMAVFDWQA